MLSFLKKIFKSGADEKSNERAKSRLHFVLVQDRTGLDGEEMSKFKSELISVIDNYFEIDKDAFDITYQREDESTALVINSPVVVRRAQKKTPRNKSEKKEGSGQVAPAAV